MTKIAENITSQAKENSIVRRISRFLTQFGADVKISYAKEIVPILARLSVSGSIRLLIDGSKIGFGHQLVMVSVAYRQRSIPVAWTWVKYKRGHSTGEIQVKLLNEVKTLLQNQGSKVNVILCGDSEFGRKPFTRHGQIVTPDFSSSDVICLAVMLWGTPDQARVKAFG